MCTEVEFHTSYVCTYFSTALPVTVLNTSGQLRIAMVLHFVSYDFLWFGELRCWKTSADNFEKLRRRTTVFTSTDIQLRTLNFVFLSLHCHGRMDFELTDFCSLQYRVPFLANVVNLHFMFFWTLVFHRKP